MDGMQLLNAQVKNGLHDSYRETRRWCSTAYSPTNSDKAKEVGEGSNPFELGTNLQFMKNAHIKLWNENKCTYLIKDNLYIFGFVQKLGVDSSWIDTVQRILYLRYLA